MYKKLNYSHFFRKIRKKITWHRPPTTCYLRAKFEFHAFYRTLIKTWAFTCTKN